MHSSLRPLVLSALLSGVTLPAFAEITPGEVWADWQRMLATYGMETDIGREEVSGDTIALFDVAMTYVFPDDGGTFATIVPELRFEGRGDGTVEIAISPELEIDIAATDAETDTPFSFTAIARQPGLVTIASRDGETTRYDYIGPLSSVTVDGIEVDGDDLDLTITASLTGMTGSYEVTEGTPRRFVGRTGGDAFVVTFDGTDPEDEATSFDLDLTINDMEWEGAGTITSLASFANMSALLSAGFASEWDVTHGAAEYTILADSPSDVFNMTSTAESGRFSGAIAPEGLVYGGGNTGVEVALSGSDIPFPQLTFSMAEMAGELAMPSRPTEEMSDFGLFLRLVDLEVSEAIWGMFDPAGQLPRDPATLVLDMAGKGRWLVDIFDPEIAEEMESDEAPGEIESLTIGGLRLSAAGAELTGDGAFEFDNSGTGPFAPAPSPSGALNLELEGGNALLDTLVAMGLVPEEQAMGVRMMLGLFARPGDGPDTLVSTIEVGTDGSISANGQRIR
ncbi:MAG: DUF2125 domain-containing protein [Paracoccaceae bacterium]|nr:DUF2125 domain-containing protein [Paracoccaceae bacterium]